MQYFRIDAGKFIEYDEATQRATILVKADLQSQKDGLVARIGTPDPNQPKTNADWIAWAKSNYPYVSHVAEQNLLDQINAQLDAIRSL